MYVYIHINLYALSVLQPRDLASIEVIRFFETCWWRARTYLLRKKGSLDYRNGRRHVIIIIIINIFTHVSHRSRDSFDIYSSITIIQLLLWICTYIHVHAHFVLYIYMYKLATVLLQYIAFYTITIQCLLVLYNSRIFKFSDHELLREFNRFSKRVYRFDSCQRSVYSRCVVNRGKLYENYLYTIYVYIYHQHIHERRRREVFNHFVRLRVTFFILT